jgi:hypothetical protein
MLEGAIISAVSLLTGMGIGRAWPARRKGPKPARPVCGCGHDLSYHEPDGDGGGTVCHARTEKYLGYDHPDKYHFGECGCKQYTGPRVLDPGYVAREITDA